MALDAYGVAVSLLPLCPLDGTAGPYVGSATGVYPDGNTVFWRLDFGATSTASQQQSAIAALALLTAYVAPVVPAPLTPYRLTGFFTTGSLLAIGTTTMSVVVSGILRNDTPMIAFGTALPSGVDVRAAYPDPSRDGYMILQVAILSTLSGSTTVPFTLIGVR